MPATDPAYARADALVDLGRYDQARAELATVLAREPQWTAAWCLLSYAERMAGDNAAALATADRAIGTDPASATAHRVRAMALSGLGRGADALDAARESVRLGPLDWTTHLVLANVLVRKIERPVFPGRRRCIAEARAAADRAVALAPEQPASHVTRGMLDGACGRNRRAAACYREALRVDPGHTPAVYHLAHNQARQNRLVRALTGYAAVLANEPGFDAARRGFDKTFRRLVESIHALALPSVVVLCMLVAADRGRAVAGLAVFGLAAWVIVRLARLPASLGRRARRNPLLHFTIGCVAATLASAWLPLPAAQVAWWVAFGLWLAGLGYQLARYGWRA